MGKMRLEEYHSALREPSVAERAHGANALMKSRPTGDGRATVSFDSTTVSKPRAFNRF